MKLRGSNKIAPTSYSILSNTIVLVLIGLFILLFLHINNITNIAKEKVNIVVEFNDNTSRNQIDRIRTKLLGIDDVLEESISIIPKKEAATILGINDPTLAERSLDAFKDILMFNVKADYYNVENLSKLREDLKKNNYVFDVYYENIIINNIKSNLKSLSIGIFILAVIFIILAVIIIYNTVNLSLYSDRWEIKTMEIIGARDSFIRKPYIKLGGQIALKSFLLSGLILASAVSYLWIYIPVTHGIIQWWYLVITYVILFLLSFIIIVGATIRIVNKYLNKNEEDLYD